MSLGTWNPDAGAANSEITLDAVLLQRLISYSDNDRLTLLDTLIVDDDSQYLSGLMGLDKERWVAAAEELTEEEIRHLIRFFAVAENLPGWEAGDNSPVIPLAKVLRKRGHRLEKEFLLWLREVNENRYLPYGPL